MVLGLPIPRWGGGGLGQQAHDQFFHWKGSYTASHRVDLQKNLMKKCQNLFPFNTSLGFHSSDFVTNGLSRFGLKPLYPIKVSSFQIPTPLSSPRMCSFSFFLHLPPILFCFAAEAMYCRMLTPNPDCRTQSSIVVIAETRSTGNPYFPLRSPVSVVVSHPYIDPWWFPRLSLFKPLRECVRWADTPERFPSVFQPLLPGCWL